MNDANPYESPQAESGRGLPADPGATAGPPGLESAALAPVLWTGDTILPRYVAASLDNALALFAAVVVAKLVQEHHPVVPTLVAAITYLAYFGLFEGLVARTPGKLLGGLIVVQPDGRRCTWGQTAIRTAWRLLEVNPLLLGALPAAIRIVWNKRRQRFGDHFAGTLVVMAQRLPRKDRSSG